MPVFFRYLKSDNDYIALIWATRFALWRAALFLWIRPLLAIRSRIGCMVANAVIAVSLLPVAIAAYTFLTKVRIMERRLALCWRRFSAWTARFLADLILAKVQLPNITFWTFQRPRTMPFSPSFVNGFVQINAAFPRLVQAAHDGYYGEQF